MLDTVGQNIKQTKTELSVLSKGNWNWNNRCTTTR